MVASPRRWSVSCTCCFAWAIFLVALVFTLGQQLTCRILPDHPWKPLVERMVILQSDQHVPERIVGAQAQALPDSDGAAPDLVMWPDVRPPLKNAFRWCASCADRAESWGGALKSWPSRRQTGAKRFQGSCADLHRFRLRPFDGQESGEHLSHDLPPAL